MEKLWFWIKTELFGHCPKCSAKRCHRNFIKGDVCPNKTCNWVHKKEDVEKDLGKDKLMKILKSFGKV